MKRKYADLLLIFITAIWGLSFPIIRNSLNYIPELTYLFYRFLAASIVLAVIFHRKIRSITRTVLWKGALMGVSISGALGFTVIALRYTTAANVAFITGMNIVIVPLLSGLMLKKKVDWVKKGSVLIAMIGLFLISGGVELKFNRGDFLAFLCALCISLQIILTDLFAADEDPVILGCLQVNVAAVIYFFLSLISGIGFAFEVKGIVVTTILVTGIAGTALAFVGQTFVQKFTTPSHVAIIFVLEPVFGALFALWIPRLDGTTETISVIKGAGCVLLVISMLFTEIFGAKADARSKLHDEIAS